jgi:methyl-galactoside transport system substrate-binding protein
LSREKGETVRRRIAILCVLAMLAAMAGCGAGDTAPTIRVGVALYQQDDTFIDTVTRDLQRLALEEEQNRNIKINLNIADGRGSQTVQNEQVDRFLDRGYDVICVNIVDRTAAAVIIDKAQAADVPVIFFNREPVVEDLRRWEHAYYVGLSAGEAGYLQGNIVLDAWQAPDSTLDRNGDGILQYVMLEGEPGHQDTLLRTENSIRTLAEGGVSTEKLASDSADWQRGQAGVQMHQWIMEFGPAVEVVFSNNDDMALGAIDACLEAGMTKEELPFIVGVDATPPALEALAAGTLQGTVRNDAAGQAAGIMALVCALTAGEDPAKAVELTDGNYVWLQYTAVIREDLTETES